MTVATKVKHVVALSGGKDSAALAVHLKKTRPNLDVEYVFTDTGCELPETYHYLDRIRALLNIDITVIQSSRNFDYWLKYYGGVLPSPQSRWCTRHLKIEPYEKYLGDALTHSYIAIRADEDREGYQNTRGNIVPVYPFIDDNITLQDVIDILTDSGLGLPEYYEWRNRSGCYFCFYQRENEWIGLKKRHPELFNRACGYEENHDDGRVYTWRQGRDKQASYLREIQEPDVLVQQMNVIQEQNDLSLLTQLRAYWSKDKIDEGN